MRIRDYEGGLRLTPLRIAHSIQRRAKSRLLAHQLDAYLANSNSPIAKPTGRAIVSLTTYGPRTKQVHRAIASIARGDELPKRIILWVDNGQFDIRNYPHLEALAARGLEVLPTNGAWGPHKKYYPAIDVANSEGVPLITADDDVAYPHMWLRTILNVSSKDADSIYAYRAKRVTLTPLGQLAPYSQWPVALAADAECGRLFSTGVSGVLFPLHFLNYVQRSNATFMERCPRADDVWLNMHALRLGTSVKLTEAESRDYPILPGSQTVSLASTNVAESRNDAQIQTTFLGDDMLRLIESART